MRPRWSLLPGHLIVEVYDIDVMREQKLAIAAIGRPKGQTDDQLISDLEPEGRCIVIAGSKPCKFLTDSFSRMTLRC